MGWFSGLFATEKAVDNILDNEKGLLVRAGGWFDGLQHTDQEKAEDRQKIREWGLRQLDALAPFKVMQRIMVTIIMSVWAMFCVAELVAIFIWSTNVPNDILMFIQTPFVWVPVSGAVGLYLMGGVIPRKGQS